MKTLLIKSFLAILTLQNLAHGADLPNIGFSIIKTSNVSVRESFVYSGGEFNKMVTSNFSAFLIKHKDSYFLLDTGLGHEVDQQYDKEMPFWQRPFFKYEKPVVTASEQLKQAGFPAIKKIFISHSHWDHAGAIIDFPGAEVWTSSQEMQLIKHPTTGAGGTWASQVSDKSIDWHDLQFKDVAYEGFPKSFDLFDDGSVVFVPMSGHTPGSVGMFLTVDSGKKYFFVGDIIWRVEALNKHRPKFFAARSIVDGDCDGTQKMIDMIADIRDKNPNISIVPAHDGGVQDSLGYFPNWVK